MNKRRFVARCVAVGIVGTVGVSSSLASAADADDEAFLAGLRCGESTVFCIDYATGKRLGGKSGPVTVGERNTILVRVLSRAQLPDSVKLKCETTNVPEMSQLARNGPRPSVAAPAGPAATQLKEIADYSTALTAVVKALYASSPLPGTTAQQEAVAASVVTLQSELEKLKKVSPAPPELARAELLVAGLGAIQRATEAIRVEEAKLAKESEAQKKLTQSEKDEIARKLAELRAERSKNLERFLHDAGVFLGIPAAPGVVVSPSETSPLMEVFSCSLQSTGDVNVAGFSVDVVAQGDDPQRRTSRTRLDFKMAHGYYYFDPAVQFAVIVGGQRLYELNPNIGTDGAATSKSTIVAQTTNTTRSAIALNVFPGGHRRASLGAFDGGFRFWDLVGLQVGLSSDVTKPLDTVLLGGVIEPVSGIGVSGGVAMVNVQKLRSGYQVGQVVPQGTVIGTDDKSVRAYVGVSLGYEIVNTVSALVSKKEAKPEADAPKPPAN